MSDNVYEFPREDNIIRKKLIAIVEPYLSDPDYEAFSFLINHFADENNLEAREIERDTDYLVSRDEAPDKISLFSYDGERLEISSFASDRKEGEFHLDLFLQYLRDNDMQHRVERYALRDSGKLLDFPSRTRE